MRIFFTHDKDYFQSIFVTKISLHYANHALILDHLCIINIYIKKH